MAQARHRLTALESERESNRQILESAAADLAAAQSALVLCQQDAAAAAAGLAEIERQQEESRVAIFDTVSSASRLRNQLAQAEERLAGADRDARRLQTEIANANTQVEAFGGQRGQLALEFETVTQRSQRHHGRNQPTAAVSSNRKNSRKLVRRPTSTFSAPNTRPPSARKARSKRSSPSTDIPPSPFAVCFNPA